LRTRLISARTEGGAADRSAPARLAGVKRQPLRPAEGGGTGVVVAAQASTNVPPRLTAGVAGGVSNGAGIPAAVATGPLTGGGQDAGPASTSAVAAVTTGEVVAATNHPAAPPGWIPKHPKPSVAWPRLRCTGILDARKAGSASAILNSRWFVVGDTIEGVTVVEISSKGVELEYQGERRLLKVNSSTE
jgi:hypothetical protein